MSTFGQFSVVQDISYGSFYERERMIDAVTAEGEDYQKRMPGNISRIQKLRFVSYAGQFKASMDVQLTDGSKPPVMDINYDDFVALCREVVRQLDDPNWPSSDKDCVPW